MNDPAFTFEYRIFYEDVDIGGVVYHSKYLNLCERARSEHFFSQDKSPIFEDYHFVVKHLEADFKAPAKFGETVRIVSKIQTRKSASFVMRQEIFNGEGTLLFVMSLTLVCLKGTNVSKIPDYFLKVFDTPA